MEDSAFDTYDMSQGIMDDASGEAVGAGIAGGAAGMNPYLIGAMVGLKMLEGRQKAKEQERQEKFAAKQQTQSNMQRALTNLANIGQAMKL